MRRALGAAGPGTPPPPQDPPTPGVSPPEPELCSGRAEIGAGSPRRCRFVSRDGRGRRADRMNGREQSGAVSPCPRSHPRHPPRSGAGRAAGRSREAPPLLLCHWLRQSRLRAGLPQRWERAAGSPALRAPPAAPSAPPCRAAASSARRRWRLRSETWATRTARGAPRAPPGRGVGLGSRGQVRAGGGGDASAAGSVALGAVRGGGRAGGADWERGWGPRWLSLCSCGQSVHRSFMLWGCSSEDWRSRGSSALGSEGGSRVNQMHVWGYQTLGVPASPLLGASGEAADPSC